MNADGSDPHRVSEGLNDDNPAWSPDGRQICFDRAGSIWAVASGGGVSRRLAEGLECSWEAGSGRILFARPQGYVREIYRMNPAGAGRIEHGSAFDPVGNVTNNARGNGTPLVSRDGSRIAFNSNRDGFGFGIFVMNADGSAQTRITARGVFDMQPSWSPDGRWVVFARDRNRSWEIYKIAVP
jgi:Tol biopolymer transport system component